MLRELGIPARYAVGFAVHEGSGRTYVVRERDAHAWCLVWKNGKWQNFDTTPPSWLAAESKHTSVFQSLSDFWSRIWFEFSKFRWGQSHVREYIFIGLIPVLGLLLYQIISRGRRHRPRRKLAAPGALIDWPGLDSELYELETRLAERSGQRAEGEPISSWMTRAAAEAFPDDPADLQQLLRLHYRYRFDPAGLPEADRAVLRAGVQSRVMRLIRHPHPHPRMQAG